MRCCSFPPAPSRRGDREPSGLVSSGAGVLALVAREQLPLTLGTREEDRDEGRAEEDGHDPGRVRPLVTLEEGGLRPVDDLLLN